MATNHPAIRVDSRRERVYNSNSTPDRRLFEVREFSGMAPRLHFDLYSHREELLAQHLPLLVQILMGERSRATIAQLHHVYAKRSSRS